MILQDIYDTIPEIDCKGLCSIDCTIVMAYPAEVNNLPFGTHFKNPKDPKVIAHYTEDHESDRDGCITCPMLTSERKCKIYDKRPLICRLYGVAEGMECRFGCKPKTRYLTWKEVLCLISTLYKLGGPPARSWLEAQDKLDKLREKKRK